MDPNSKISIAGQLTKKARLFQDRRDHMFLIVRSGDLPDYICTERLLGGQKWSDASLGREQHDFPEYDEGDTSVQQSPLSKQFGRIV